MAAEAGMIRFVGLFWPLLLTVALWLWRQPGPRWRAGMIVAACWNGSTLLLLHLLAQQAGWWRFAAAGGLFLGIPVDLYLGWVLLWSTAPALAMPNTPMPLLLLILLGVDLVVMPQMAPVVQLGERWWLGESLGLVVCLWPAQLLVRWTKADSQLFARCTFLVITFGLLFLVTLPLLTLRLTGGSLAPFWALPTWVSSLAVQLLALPVIIGVSAVQEFAQRGGGTPLPFDPPKRLVTSGIYAYIANPMQLVTLLLLLGLGGLFHSFWLMAGALITLIYSSGLAHWSEQGDLAVRFGQPWRCYRQLVRNWWPRWQPWHGACDPHGGRPVDRLYLAMSCGPCSELAGWFEQRQPIALELSAAESFPGPLPTRLTFVHGEDGAVETGINALARGLEHLHLGWAVIGCFLRLPLVAWFVQILIDAIGAGPRQLDKR